MSTDALPCFKCGKQLRNVDENESNNQPYEGTAFSTSGHYGSTIYDPMDGRFIELNLCDQCLAEGSGNVLEGRRAKPVFYNGSIVGWCKVVDRGLVTWNPEFSSFDREDALHIDESVLERPEDYPEIYKWNVAPAVLLEAAKRDD